MGWYPPTFCFDKVDCKVCLSFYSRFYLCVTKFCYRSLVHSQPLFYLVPHDKEVKKKKNCSVIWRYKCSLIIYQNCKWSMIDNVWMFDHINLELNLSFFFTSGFLSDPGLAFVLQRPFSEQQTHHIVVTWMRYRCIWIWLEIDSNHCKMMMLGTHSVLPRTHLNQSSSIKLQFHNIPKSGYQGLHNSKAMNGMNPRFPNR